MQAFPRSFTTALLMIWLVFSVPCQLVAAEDLLPSSAAAEVVFRNQPLLTLRPVQATVTPEERARIIEHRLQEIADNDAAETAFYHLEDSAGETRILINNKLIVSVSNADAASEKMSRRELAENWGTTMQRAVQQYYLDRQPKNIAIRLGQSLVATILFVMVWRILGWLARLFKYRLQKSFGDSIRIQKFVLLSAQNTRSLMKYFVRLFLWPARLALLYGYIYLILLIFPITRSYANLIIFYLWQPSRKIGQFLLDITPDLFTILIIVIICYYILAILKLFCREIEKGSIALPSFHPEWAAPAYTIIRTLAIILAFIAIFPFIPGSNSPVFQGMSVFLGLLVSVASSSTLANVVAGYVLIFTKAFKEGDVIRVGEYTGSVVQRSLLATHLRTFKNEIVTVPNSLLVSGSILNYSTNTAEAGVILYTKVTIGYNAPWRTVHELLKQAAARTDGILSDPSPYVLQNALDDFYVSYELNAFTRNPADMPRLYSDLHHNIQDCFNEGGVEIMSPHYAAFRNGNESTIPKN